MSTFPSTVRVNAPICSRDSPLNAGPVTVKLLQAPVALSVTSNPLSITTSLQEVGAEAPGVPFDEVAQVAVLVQLPLATANRVPPPTVMITVEDAAAQGPPASGSLVVNVNVTVPLVMLGV